MNSLEASLLGKSHLLSIDLNTAEVGHAIGFESGATALNIDVLLLRPLPGHANFLTLPEREWSLSLLGDLDRLLLGLDYGGWDRRSAWAGWVPPSD